MEEVIEGYQDLSQKYLKPEEAKCSISSPKALKPLECLPSSPIRKELIVSSMQERIRKMVNHADAFILFLRDLATLEAPITFASWPILNIHQKPISLLNIKNFYNGLTTFVNYAIKNHCINELFDL